MSDAQADQDRLRMFTLQVFSKLEGAFTAGMIHLGDRLGLYRAMARADGPITSHELADRVELHERWVREWLANQAAAQLIDHDSTGEVDRFALSGEGRAGVRQPRASGVRDGDVPPPAGDDGRSRADAQRRLRRGSATTTTATVHRVPRGSNAAFEPWNNANLLRRVLPAMDGVVERMRTGASVVDVGCGAGGAVLPDRPGVPRTAPSSGYGISQHALDRANIELRRVGAD